ncbi:MAG: glycoside hydrolase family 65 protein [Treponema sp.]|jgi:trehalose/maltose hydrolase-like predicted phosphorylase|nr:glycoside hydrolase family 65 protein [Treponema sp.]
MYNLSDWDISDVGQSEEDVLQNGNRLLTGNGYMGRRGVVDEAEAQDMPATILSGLYDHHGDLWREPVNSPDPLYSLIIADNIPVRAGDKYTVFHEQTLNFRYGIYSRHTSWQLPADRGKVTVRTERYAHMENVHLLCTRFTLCADISCQIVLKQGINHAVRDLNGPHLGNFHSWSLQSKRILGLSCKTLEQNIPLAVLSAFVPLFQESEVLNFIIKTDTVNEEGGIFSYHTINLKEKAAVTFYIYGAIYSDIDVKEPVTAAEDQIHQAIKEGWDNLLITHKTRWDKIWHNGDVIIEGDEYAQRCLRYSLYHLWLIAPRHSIATNRALSIPARGLSGQTYKGAVFWDTEMFISPYFLAVMPELAAQFIRYRIQTLPGAKRKAAEYGYRGAFFAWESQETGDDACSDFNVTDVFTGRPVRTYFRDKQIHISADVVYSIKNYFDITRNLLLLKEGALELILESARFFLSYLYYSPEHKRYEVLDVIGPDEYHERVNNNAFTNKMIFAVFETACNYIKIFKESDPEFIDDLINRINFKDDLLFMENVMQHFYIPQPDNRGIIEQFDGYFRLEDCSLDTVRSRLKDPKEYWGSSGGVATATQIIKQADVVTMLTLFNNDYSAEIKKANLDYYEPRTEHGSSLSSCMYALLACETGNSDWAYPFFIKTAEIDITGKSKHFAGLVYIGGTHPAGNGGAWLTAIRGFCGFSIENNKIKIVPRLPEHWKKVSFSVTLSGVEHKITVLKDNYTQEIIS